MVLEFVAIGSPSSGQMMVRAGRVFVLPARPLLCVYARQGLCARSSPRSTHKKSGSRFLAGPQGKERYEPLMVRPIELGCQ